MNRMNKTQRGQAVLGVLVAAAALWAYLLAHPTSGGAPAGATDVTVWSVPARGVQALVYQDGDARTTLQADWSQAGDAPYVWIETQAPAAKAAPAPPQRPGTSQGKAPNADAPAEPQPPLHEAFKGNAAAWQTLEHYAALPAERDLGRLGGVSVAELGLDTPSGTIELQRSDAPPLTLKLGRRTFGDSGRYAYDPAADRVYLLRSVELRRLGSARASLMDRDLLGLQAERATRLELSLGATTHAFVRQGEAAAWSTADGGPAAADVPGVLAALERIKAVRYGEPGEAPAGAPQLQARLFSEGRSEPAVTLRLYGGAGQTVPAESSYTRRPVQVPVQAVQQLLEAVRALR